MTAELAQAYPGVLLVASPRSWWGRRRGRPRCAHLAGSRATGIQLDPDRLQLERLGRAVAVREPARPEVELCADCLLGLLAQELGSFGGRVIAFEPGAEGLAGYRFVEQQHLGDVGLGAEDLIHCQALVGEPLGGCQNCGSEARLLWVKRGSTTEDAKLTSYRGGRGYYCLDHGSELLVACLRERLRAPLAFNFPYGERGVYIPAYR